MAQTGQKDLFTRLADAGEEAIQRLAGTPGASGVLGVVTNMRDQMDALAKRVRGMDALERRVEKLERDLARMQRGASSTTPTRKTTASARKTTAKTASRAAKSGTSSKTRSARKR